MTDLQVRLSLTSAGTEVLAVGPFVNVLLAVFNLVPIPPLATAWILLLVLLAMSVGLVSLTVLFNQWNKLFYNAIQDRNYAVFTRIGWRLTRLNYDQQRYEADFRVAFVRVRENAEGVAFYGREGGELRNFRERLAEVMRNRWGMGRQKRLGWFTASYNQLAVVFPFVMAAPRYFSGAMALGGLVQIALAFGRRLMATPLSSAGRRRTGRRTSGTPTRSSGGRRW